MNEFVKTDTFGQLYIDKILFESYYPIIFTCINDDGMIFLAVCCKRNESGIKWLVAKTKSDYIVELLSNNITIRNLLIGSNEKFSVDYVNNEYIVTVNSPDFGNNIYLPKKDSFMYAENGEFDKEIAYYKSKNPISYKTDYYKSIEGPNNVTSTESMQTYDSMVDYGPQIVTVEIREVMNTLVTLKNICFNTTNLDTGHLQGDYNYGYEKVEEKTIDKYTNSSINDSYAA